MEHQFSLLSLFPPLLVLLLGYLTRRVILSLVAGILFACFIATDFSFVNAAQLSVQVLWKNCEFDKFFSITHFSETWNFFICLFLLMLGIFVTLLQHSGGAYAYGLFIKKYITSKRKAEKASLWLSMLLFVDDYFSSLTVGSVMHPITDSKKVPRAKLCFLVDSMAAPLTILCPISSWVAAILGFLRENGISRTQESTTLILASPLSTYFHIIPFIFYSITLIAAVWFIVHFRISFGLMKKHETIAEATGNLFGNHENLAGNPNLEPSHDNASLIDFVGPILFLLASVMIAMLYSGGWTLLGGSRSLVSAFQNSSAAIALFLGGSGTLVFTTLFFIIRNKINAVKLPSLLLEGLNLMLPAIVILILAWSLGDILRDYLYTGEYLAKLMINSVDITFLPAILFITSALIAFALGSAWGTAAMIFPIAIPLVLSMLPIEGIPMLSDVPILFPVLGAVLSGCVAGDHISPISDTTVMSITSTRTPLMDHISTQMPYALPLIGTSCLGFIAASYLMPFGLLTATIIPILISISSTCLLLKLLNKWSYL